MKRTHSQNQRQLKLLEHMRKDGLENFVLTGYIKSKRDRGRQKATYLTSLCEWEVDGMPKIQMVLRATKNRNLCKAMVVHVLKGHCTQKKFFKDKALGSFMYDQ